MASANSISGALPEKGDSVVRRAAGESRPPGGVTFPMCVSCCQRFKRREVKEIKPAITFTVMVIGGIPVSVPVCIDDLDGGTNPEAPNSHKSIVSPYDGKPIT